MKSPYCIKVCSKCGKILVANTTNFHKKKEGKYGLRAECKICKKQLDKQYRENNIDAIKEYDKMRYQRDKDKRLEYCREYHKENKEHIKKQRHQYYEENKDIIKERNKRYWVENPHVRFNSTSKRRQLEESQGEGVTKEQWLEMMDFFEWKCAYSGKYIGGNSDSRTIDHIIPLDNEGEHAIWNCVPCYGNYNFSKRNKDMLSWYLQQEFYSEERLNKIYEWIEYAKSKYQIKTLKK